MSGCLTDSLCLHVTSILFHELRELGPREALFIDRLAYWQPLDILLAD